MTEALIFELVQLGLSGINQITAAIGAAHAGQMTDAEIQAEIAKLRQLRTENQAKSDALGAKLEGTPQG